MRRWRVDDAQSLRAAIDLSLPDLLPWIPWAVDEPTTLEELEARLAAYRADFVDGGDMLYALLDPEDSQVLGGIGLYRRVGPGALEVGYWIRSDRAGEGLTTEATEALTKIGLKLDGIERLEIHLDPANAASAAIPRKVGYRARETIETRDDQGEVSRTMIWEVCAEGE